MANTISNRKKPRKPKQTVKQKTLQSIQRTIREQSKKGFSWDDNFVHDLPSLSVQKLKAIRSNLFHYATYRDESGEQVKGYKGLMIKRSQAALKGAEKREKIRLSKLRTKEFRQNITKVSEQFQEQRELLEDWDVRTQIEEEGLVSIGASAYEKIRTLIDEFPTAGSEYLKKLLNSEIRRYGEENVIAALGNAPARTIQEAEVAAYYSRGTNVHEALKAIADIIKGTIETEGEQKEIGEIQDAMEDVEEF